MVELSSMFVHQQNRDQAKNAKQHQVNETSEERTQVLYVLPIANPTERNNLRFEPSGSRTLLLSRLKVPVFE